MTTGNNIICARGLVSFNYTVSEKTKNKHTNQNNSPIISARERMWEIMGALILNI